MGCEIVLIRHGETDWNAERRIQGATDIPLNEAGRRQARDLGAVLRGERYDAVWSSDLTRAVETAETLMTGRSATIRTDPDLRERDFGAFQGLTYDEARVRFPAEFDAYERRVPDARPPGGESLVDLAGRVARALDRIADAHEQALVVAHGGVLDAAYRLAAGLPLERPRDFPIRNATLNRLARRDGVWRVVSWDEQDHLAARLDELP